MTPAPRLLMICLFAAICACPHAALLGQDASGGDRDDVQAKTRSVLALLREGRLEDALRTFGEAVDSSASLDPSHDDHLAAAAAGVHRGLMQRSADERFDLLYAWSMPTEDRKAVRILATPVAQDAPPSPFARALGERPRTDSFAIAAVGDIRGLFSSGWMLVQAAEDIGRLSRLAAELERLSAQRVPNADAVLLLAQLAARRVDTPTLEKQLQQRAAAIVSQEMDAANTSRAIDASNLVLAAAALRHEELQAASEEMFNALVESTYTSSHRWRAFLRIAHATAVQLNRGESGPEVLHRNRLKYWVPATGRTAEQHAAGTVDAMWLVHEDHVLHLAGAHNDVLFCRFPLTGNFDFSCETQDGGKIGTDGGLVFGGLQYEALGSDWRLSVWDADLALLAQKACPFIRHDERPTFNRVSIRSTHEGATFAVNLHPMWFDDAASQASPWLGLRSFGERRPVFRNLAITGTAVIPRQVSLATGNQLRGWQSRFFDETQPLLDTGPAEQRESREVADESDWHIEEGVIHAAKRDAPITNPQSWLHYHRPLLDGEEVAYEFFYEPDTFEVNPALGRLAFLIEPEGVRVHWITDGAEEWTGLPPDNSLLEPLNRRGPRPVPWREQAWNAIKLSRSGGKVTLSLNEIVIYERSVDYAGDHTFGFYRDRSKTAAKIRAVVMTGDWPEALPDDFIGNPLVLAKLDAEHDGQAMNQLIGNELIAENIAVVRRRTQQFEPTDRYRFIADWVLPSETHATIRMNGQFSCTGLYCPAIELVELAQRIGCLEQLHERVARLSEPAIEEQRRAKAAMLFLVELCGGDNSAAESVATLTTLVDDSGELAFSRQWPQTVAAWFGLRKADRWPLVAELLTEMRNRNLLEHNESGSDAWSEQLAAMHGLLQHLANNGSEEDFARPPRLKNWIAASAVTAQSNAAGYPGIHWRWDGSQLQNLSSHRQSLLFYRTPLRGNFEVSCELPTDSWDEIQLMYAGEYVVPREDFVACRVGGVHLEYSEPMDPPMTEPVGPPWLRIQIRDNVCTTWFNGRLVRRRTFAEDHDPWLAVRATSSRLHPAIRNLRIDGMPVVPGEVNLCAHETLAGWSSYFEEAIGLGGAWEHVNDGAGKGLRATLQAEYRGAHKESLLCYYRPLGDDDSLEYDFYYEPGVSHVHPTLDGIAFLMQPEGVSVHPVTDGKYDPSEADPRATVVEPDCRRGPAKLPLREAMWNHCRLDVRADVVDLFLNDQLIYSRPRDADGQGLFGLFHFAGESDVQVRNVIWRHRPVDSFETIGQQLVNRDPNPLDRNFDAWQSFAHDFAASGLPSEFFERSFAPNSSIRVSGDGVTHTQTSGGKWTDSSIVPVFRMHGDFDLTVSFDELQVTEPYNGGCGVVVRGQDGRVMLISRRMTNGLHRAYLTWRDPAGDGEFRLVKDVLITEATAGRFRVARRGDTYYFLIAEYDSPVYRLVGEETIDGAGQQDSQVELRAIASLGASAAVLWKNLQINAEKLRRVRFRVTGREITQEQWQTISAADELRELILDGTSVSDADLERLRDCRDLRLLYLKSTSITSQGLAHLATLIQLESLHLTGTAIDDTAGSTLSCLPKLKTLGLSSTQVGDAVVSELSKLSKLEVLGLNNTTVTDASVESFARMTSLRRLDLRSSEVTQAGLERIRKALPQCTVRP